MIGKILYALFNIFALALIAAGILWGATGCTIIKYKDATYISILQRKSAVLEMDGKGAAKLTYNTDSDSATELAKQVATMGGEVIKAYAGK